MSWIKFRLKKCQVESVHTSNAKALLYLFQVHYDPLLQKISNSLPFLKMYAKGKHCRQYANLRTLAFINISSIQSKIILLLIVIATIIQGPKYTYTSSEAKLSLCDPGYQDERLRKLYRIELLSQKSFTLNQG